MTTSTFRPQLRTLLVGAAALLAPALVPLGAQTVRPDSATQWLRAVVGRLGGEDALRRVTTVRYRYQTLWYRPSWSRTASGLEPSGSVEENVDSRDYSIPVWRQERRFGIEPGPAAITNVVRDTVASSATRVGTGPLSPAYLDERRELFLIAPEWLLPRLLAAPDRYRVRARADTSLGAGLLHTVSAVVEGIPVDLWITRSGYLTGLRFTAAQPLDFGLAALRRMEVSVFYDQWREVSGVALPWQVSIFRGGRLYKQLLFRSVEINPSLTGDSLLVADSVRASFIARGRVAMTDIPHDSLVDLAEGVSGFAGLGVIQGAVQLREGWMLVGTGADSMQAARALARFSRAGRTVVAALLFSTSPTVLGGSRVMADAGVRFVLPSATLGAARFILGDREAKARPFRIVSSGQWMVIAGDSVWTEELDVPDAPGAVLVYVPRLHWAYLGPLGRGWPLRQGLSVLDARGFTPRLIGTPQSLARPASDVRQQAAPPSPPAR